MSEDQPFSTIKEDAAALARVAIALSNARESSDPADLKAALEANVELWVAIRTVVARPDNKLPQDVRDNLMRLSRYVTGVSVGRTEPLSDGELDSLVNINLQISEGLLEGEARAVAGTVPA